MDQATKEAFAKLTETVERGFSAVAEDIADIRARMATKEELKAFREETAENFRDLKAEVADIRRAIKNLQTRVGNMEGYSKEIVNAYVLERPPDEFEVAFPAPGSPLIGSKREALGWNFERMPRLQTTQERSISPSHARSDDMNPHIPENLTSLFDSPFTVMHTMPPRDPNDDDDDDENDEEEQDEEKDPPIVREPDPDET